MEVKINLSPVGMTAEYYAKEFLLALPGSYLVSHNKDSVVISIMENLLGKFEELLDADDCVTGYRPIN